MKLPTTIAMALLGLCAGLLTPANAKVGDSYNMPLRMPAYGMLPDAMLFSALLVQNDAMAIAQLQFRLSKIDAAIWFDKGEKVTVMQETTSDAHNLQCLRRQGEPNCWWTVRPDYSPLSQGQ